MATVKDPQWLNFLRSLPCASCLASPPSQAHHSTTGRFSMGKKNDDHEAFPLCHQCHRDFHDKHGKFKTMGKEARKLWERSMVSLYRPQGGDLELVLQRPSGTPTLLALPGGRK